MNTEPVIFETLLNADKKTLWNALTDKHAMKQWYFETEGFSAKPGAHFTFTGRTEKREYLHRCTVVDVSSEEKLSYTWKYDGFPGDSLVTFELQKEGEKTRIRVTHEGIETFPDENPDFNKSGFLQGWTHLIGKSLKEFVSKKQR